MITNQQLEHISDSEIIDYITSYIISGSIDKKGKILIPFATKKDIVEGAEFFIDNKFFEREILKIKITYVRSGIAFYIDEKEPDVEKSFPINSVFATRLEPVHYVSDLNPKYYQIESYYGKSTYEFKEKK